MTRGVLAPCGTNAAYQRGCRCDPCRYAHTEKNRRVKGYQPRRPRSIPQPSSIALTATQVAAALTVCDQVPRADVPTVLAALGLKESS